VEGNMPTEKAMSGEYSSIGGISSHRTNSFKTSLFGFDKGDVISYIDKLVQDISNQKNNIDVTLNRMTEQNSELIERINRYEKQISVIQAELEDEKLYNNNAREREELFKKAVAILQEKVAFLQNNTVAPMGEADSDLESRTKRANEIVIKLREDLLRKDENIGKLGAAISRRNDVILDQDRMIAQRDRIISERTAEINSLAERLNRRTRDLEIAQDRIVTLQNRVGNLENHIRYLNEEKERIHYRSQNIREEERSDYKGYEYVPRSRESRYDDFETRRPEYPYYNDVRHRAPSDEFRLDRHDDRQNGFDYVKEYRPRRNSFIEYADSLYDRAGQGIRGLDDGYGPIPDYRYRY